MKSFAITVGLALLFSTITPLASPFAAPPQTQVLFEDFSYANRQALKQNGWIIRTEAGWPGVPGATWKEEGVSILKDPAQPKNQILRMTSTTDGTPANTTQTQI